MSSKDKPNLLSMQPAPEPLFQTFNSITHFYSLYRSLDKIDLVRAETYARAE